MNKPETVGDEETVRWMMFTGPARLWGKSTEECARLDNRRNYGRPLLRVTWVNDRPVKVELVE